MTFFPASPKSPSVLTIDLAALAENYRTCVNYTQAKVAAVIKANAYGLGAEPVFKRLRREGCTEFFVATFEEALFLRNLDQQAEIYVLGGLYEGAENDYIQNRITPVLNAVENIVRYNAVIATHGTHCPAILHFDTGMNRLGIRAEELSLLLDDRDFLKRIDLRAVMSHFACSDENGHPLNETQAERFRTIATSFPEIRKSLCNSSGLFRQQDWHHDLVRPGFALYGGNPTPETTNPMRAVIRLNTRILQVHPARKGESAGYGASYVFDRDTSLAVVALGYADGFLRSADHQAALYWNGTPCPVRGRVSMDLIIVEIGHLQNPPRPGQWLEVIGPHQTIDALAEARGTIGYEILTSLGSRYERVYES